MFERWVRVAMVTAAVGALVATGAPRAVAMGAWSEAHALLVTKSSAATLRCHGNEPFWNASLDGDRLEIDALGTSSAPKGAHVGRHERLDWAEPPLIVWRGRPATDTIVLVAQRVPCHDTMMDRPPYGWSAILSTATDVWLGCCEAP